MYYAHNCSYCNKLFYTYQDNRERASEVLYHGIKKHLIDYGEDHKEYEFDEAPEIEINQLYRSIVELSDEPSGGYELK